MLAIQQFVNAREQNILESGDCSAFYKYINLRRMHREGVALLYINMAIWQQATMRMLKF